MLNVWLEFKWLTSEKHPSIRRYRIIYGRKNFYDTESVFKSTLRSSISVEGTLYTMLRGLFHITLSSYGPLAFHLKLNYIPETVFAKLHFLQNLEIGPIS